MPSVPWTVPADVRAVVRKKWDSGALLGALARGDEWTPWAIPIRGPAARELGERLADVQRWVREWQRPGPLRVEYRQVGGRHFGTNSVPCRAWLDTRQQAWDLLAVHDEVARFTALAELTGQACPRLTDWVARRPIRLLGLEACWAEILQTVLCIEKTDPSGERPYLRQLDVPGVDTKFIEQHRGMLTELLDTQLDPARVDRAAADFENRYGFRRKPRYVRFRCPGLAPFPGSAAASELTVRAEEFVAPPRGVRRVFVVENEITYLAFPLPDDAMVIWGSGYAVPVLEPLRWLPDLEVMYWGDIDTHGFVILDRLRGLFPHVRSMLMDQRTLLAHRSQWVTEPAQARDELTRLDDAEARLYRDLIFAAFGPAVRLEQERVSYGAIETAVRARV
jgi:hypothetical protein